MNQFKKLIEIVKKLRSPDGCDWDKKQTNESLVPYLLEEVYEVIEAIENEDYSSLKEELGDLLLHIVFQADLSDEKNKFSINDSIEAINNKLINRHQHIFKNNNIKIYEKENWELIKQREKNRISILEGIPKSLPALLKARRIQEKAASVGFDWNNQNQVLEKIDEEINELKEAIVQNKGIEDELGDVLFTIVNLCRHLKIDPEKSLRFSIEKFSKRFQKIEQKLNSEKINIQDLSLEELDTLWKKIKLI